MHQDILGEDVLPTIHPHLDGMSWNRAWTYNGGQGVAGVHAEDGFLHFAHHMVDMKLVVEDQLTRDLVDLLYGLSSKVWVFYRGLYREQQPAEAALALKSLQPAEAALALNKIVAEMWGVESLADELLVAREFVLDPRVFAGDGRFEVVVQKNGEMVFGNAYHSVMGAGFFSFACNVALVGAIQSYILAEAAMARAVRGVSKKYLGVRKAMEGGVEPAIRNFVFVASMVSYYLDACLGGRIGLGRFDSIIKMYVRFVYGADRARGHLAVPVCLKDEEHVPVNENDAQCEMCGGSYVSCKYVLEGGVGMCVECVSLGSGQELQVVPLLPTAVAKRVGLGGC